MDTAAAVRRGGRGPAHSAARRWGALLCGAWLGAAAASEHTDRLHVRVYGSDPVALERAGINAERRIDYGSFQWWVLPSTERTRLDRSGLRYEIDPHAPRLYLGDLRFDPLERPGLLESTPLDGSGRGLQLVQFHGPLQRAWVSELEQRGWIVLGYQPSQAVLVFGAAERLDELRSLPSVRWAGPYPPAARIDPELASAAVSGELEVLLYGAAPSALAALGARGASVRRLVPAQPDRRLMLAIVAGEAIAPASLAGIPEVVYVGPRHALRPDDEQPNQIVAGNVGGDGRPWPGYRDWLRAIGSKAGRGLGWAVVDSGVDLDHPDLAPAIQGGVDDPGCSGGRPGDDVGGHGTHVAGILAGRGQGDRSGPAQERDPQRFYYGQGLAPAASIYVLRAIGAGCAQWSDADRSRAALLGGVHGSNNSWNNSFNAPRLTYGISERTHDIMVRDGNFDTPAQEPFTLVFSAGNSGPGPGTITGPKAAKNLIVVGSSNNARAADPALLSPFSSRGPLADGRLAPTLVAVGGTQASTRRALGGLCASEIAGTEGLYGTCFGTSMSTPQVSAAAVLLTEDWQRRHGAGRPSPALLKALLVNAARDLPGSSPGGTLNDGSRPIPNADEGWGILDLRAALASPLPRLQRDQEHVLSSAGETWTWVIGAADPDQPVKLTLVWTDAPGAASVGSGPALVNDLDLEVQDGIQLYRGNVFGAGWSVTGGSADRLNNIESVYLRTPSTSPIHVRVRAAALNADALSGNGTPSLPRQDFALVCSNCVEPGFTLSSPQPSGALCVPNVMDYTLEIGSRVGHLAPVALSSSGLPPGVSGSIAPNPVLPGGTARLELVGTTTAPGRYTLEVQGVSGTLVERLPLHLAVANALPGAVLPLLPADFAVAVPLRPLLRWSAVGAEARVQLQVATDPSFLAPILDLELGEAEYRLANALDRDRQYFWRVRARNPCGDGPWSPMRSFRTAASVCFAAPIAIPDGDGSGATSTLLTGAPGRLADLRLALQLTHPRIGELEVRLRHVPTNRSARVFTRPALCDLADVDAEFDDQAADFAQCFAGPVAIVGQLQPEDGFTRFHGLGATGPWQLVVIDAVSGASGSVTRWCLTTAAELDALHRDGFEP